MKNFTCAVLILALFGSAEGFAYTPEEGKVNLVMGPYHYKTNFDGSGKGALASYKDGLAMIALGDVSDHGSLEIGIFFLQKQYFREYQGGFLGTETSLVHITTGYRFWHTPYLSSSLAVFSAYPFGETTTIHNSLAPGTVLDTSAGDNAEYGLEAAFQGEVLTSGKFAIVLEGRYSYSLTHKKDEYADHFGGLIGLRYLIQEEKVHETKPPTAK
jgi:hypothetical protein